MFKDQNTPKKLCQEFMRLKAFSKKSNMTDFYLDLSIFDRITMKQKFLLFISPIYSFKYFLTSIYERISCSLAYKIFL